MNGVRLDDQTVLVVDICCSIARSIVHLLATRGANLVLNVLEGAHPTKPGSGVEAVETFINDVDSIGVGGVLRTFEPAQNFEKVVQAAVKKFGAVHAILSNGTFQRHPDLHEWNDARIWEAMMATDVDSSYMCTKAVWPYFRGQAYGRIIYLGSRHEPSSSATRIARSAAEFAHMGLVKSLAKEGSKYNIRADVVALSSSISTQTDESFESDDSTLQNLTSLVAVLLSSSVKADSGSTYAVDANGVTVCRFQRALGSSLNPDAGFSAASVLANWQSVVDYSKASFPDGPADFGSVLSHNQRLRDNADTELLDFAGKVVIVTGAASGLGRCYALAFAKLGASLVVNDITDCGKVVQEIRVNGGTAVPMNTSVEEGEAIISCAILNYGRVDVVVNNAGFLRDKAFTNMTAETWDSVLKVHLNGTHAVTAAAWPYFQRQGYGRVLNTTSTSGIYGVFGQTNYAAAKLGIAGLSNALAQEGINDNIHVNCIAPVASTGALAAAFTGTGNMNDQKTFKAEYVVPLALLLCSDKLCSTPYATGNMYEVGCGWQAQTRLQSISVYHAAIGTFVTPESMQQDWEKLLKIGEPGPPATQAPKNVVEPDVLRAIQEYKKRPSPTTNHVCSKRDIILYNLAVGAGRDELSLIYEEAENFQALPTFGMIPFFTPDVVHHHRNIFPNFTLGQSLLAEHYLEIRKYPIPTSGNLTTTSKLLGVLDKGNSAIAITGYTTRDSVTDEIVFYNEVTFFMRGCGGFGGQREPSGGMSMGSASRRYALPVDRAPDAVAEYKTSKEQAALYRLTGDTISMHIDPKVSVQGGFPTPILHGACFMGIAGKQIFERYGAFKSIKVKFSGLVIPGDTLKTDIWKERGSQVNWVLFRMTVVETGKICIAGGVVELVNPVKTEGKL